MIGEKMRAELHRLVDEHMDSFGDEREAHGAALCIIGVDDVEERAEYVAVVTPGRGLPLLGAVEALKALVLKQVHDPSVEERDAG